MTPPSSNGPGRGPGRNASGRSGAARGSAPRRKPSPPASSSKKAPAERKPAPKKPQGSKPRRPPVSASRSTGLLPQAPARTRPVVSKTSAQRFAAKVRARRRKQTLIAIVTVMALTGAGWVTIFSPWATVNEVEITGLDRVDETDVRVVSDAELGHSLLLARTADVADRLEKIRLVKDVQVSRSWPGVLKVAVTERRPVAALPSVVVAGNATSGTARNEVQMVQLVDDEGVVIETVPAPSTPDGLPRIEVKLGQKQSVANLRGTLAVLNDLPAGLTSRLRAIGTSSPDGIWMKLAAPTKAAKKRTVLVQWGDAEQNAKKAEVLGALLKQKAKSYDVRAPEMPSTAS